MLFYLHYMLMTSGLSGTSVLLAVYFKTYTDASQSEIGALLMTFPFVCLIIKPLFCSMADRHQAHRTYFISAILVEMFGYMPFVVIPFFPNFYEQYPRLAWYVLVIACHIGNGGLGVAWSLGDCLAVNYSQKTGTPFGRMRLMGTLSWGLYGFIIGQINEVPMLPKYLPAFIILHLSLLMEITMVVLWNKRDFEMVDPLAALQTQEATSSPAAAAAAAAASNKQVVIVHEQQQQQQQHQNQHQSMNTSEQQLAQLELDKSANPQAITYDLVDSMPSSLGGTLRLQPKTANVFRDVLAADELLGRLKGIEAAGAGGGENTPTVVAEKPPSEKPPAIVVVLSKEQEATGAARHIDHLEAGTLSAGGGGGCGDATRKNPQLILLKMILIEDGRVLKYICLFTIFGLLMAPMNFLFLSMEELCRERDYNFSQLAGAVLISQAAIESLAFLVVPWCMQYMSKTAALSTGLIIMSAKWVFYSGWYYSAGISPYWAVLSEWSHGISYGIFCTIQADVSLMFANSSRLFIPELRKLGFLSSEETSSRERIEAEEKSIKMALRATMQALFSGFMDGLGQGAGALLCGVFIEIYSYVTVWKVFSVITFVAIAVHLFTELTKSRWSDTYKPRKGTKGDEIMALSRAYEAEAAAKSRHAADTAASRTKTFAGDVDGVKTKKGAESAQQTAAGC